MNTSAFPHLAQLLGAWFHQDCYDEGESDSEILSAYFEASHRPEVSATIADIDRFLLQGGDAKQRLEETFTPSVEIGTDDPTVRQWLRAAREQIAGLLAR